MAKGNRSRSKKVVPPEQGAIVKKEVEPLQVQELQLIENFVNLAKNYTQILKQKQQYDYALKTMEETRNKIQKGELTSIMIPIAPNTSAPITDKKAMIEYMDEQIRLIKQSVVAINGSAAHKKELYIEGGLSLQKWTNRKFSSFKPADISTFRNTKEEEKVLFEQAFEDLNIEEFEKAKAKAIKLNEKGN
jgi:hypothetical protein